MDKLHIITAAELIKEARTQIAIRQGKCFLDGTCIVLNVCYPYEIELSRCDSPEKILHWVWHLGEKNWVTAELIRDFVSLACSVNGIEK